MLKYKLCRGYIVYPHSHQCHKNAAHIFALSRGNSMLCHLAPHLAFLARQRHCVQKIYAYHAGNTIPALYNKTYES